MLNHTDLDYIRKYSVLNEAKNEYVLDRPVFGYIEYSNVSLQPYCPHTTIYLKLKTILSFKI